METRKMLKKEKEGLKKEIGSDFKRRLVNEDKK